MADVTDIIEVFTTVMGRSDHVSKMTESTQLMGSFPGLDSITIVNIILSIEEHFGIRVYDDDIDAADFESVNSLLFFINNKLA